MQFTLDVGRTSHRIELACFLKKHNQTHTMLFMKVVVRALTLDSCYSRSLSILFLNSFWVLGSDGSERRLAAEHGEGATVQ